MRSPAGLARRLAAAAADRLARRPGWERWIGPEDDVVVGQALALAALAWPGRARWRLPGVVVAAAGTALAVGTGLALAGAAPHGGRLTPRVEPPDDAALLTGGAYAAGRHPVYGGLLVATAGWAVLRRRPEPLAAWLALLAVLSAKTRREEVRLVARYGAAYEGYRARTPRFVGLPRGVLDGPGRAS